jgi:hypothetical protein
MRTLVSRGVSVWLIATSAAIVCSAQIPFFAPSDAVAKAKVINGQVSILKDSYPWALQAGSSVRPQEIILTGPDGYAQFEVSDGSTFEVFPSSRIVFRSNPGNLRDLLEVLIGRVKVHIQKFGGQPNPNKVKSPTAVISVRGTIFDVLVEDDGTTLVSVDEGQVAVTHTRFLGQKERLVNQGESIRIFKDQPLARQRIDKGSAAQVALRAMADAIYTILYRGSGGAGGAGGGPTLKGDTTGQAPPPPPPPPPGGDTSTAPPPPPPPAQ